MRVCFQNAEAIIPKQTNLEEAFLVLKFWSSYLFLGVFLGLQEFHVGGDFCVKILGLAILGLCSWSGYAERQSSDRS